MSVSLLHHGHIRLLKKASELGDHVIVALTTDDEVIKHKGHAPELSFDERKEILEALRYVDEVVPCPWQIDDDFLQKHDAALLVHSGENFNAVSNLKVLERTPGISSTDMRKRALDAVVVKRNTERCLLTPGPGNIDPDSIFDIRPVFTRADHQYDELKSRVFSRIKALTGHDTVAAMQGSATTAIEVGMASFVRGSVVVVNSGYYSTRLHEMLKSLQSLYELKSLQLIAYDDFLNNWSSLGKADWVLAAYTETADAFLSDIKQIHLLSSRLGAKLFLDATGSINLEDNHDLADICAFSSCKGLAALTGAAFLTFNQTLISLKQKNLSLIHDIDTYLESKTTQPAHAICSLDSISDRFSEMKSRVRKSKEIFLDLFAAYTSAKNQPALCTRLKGIQLDGPDWVLMYQPRVSPAGTQVICHLFDQFPSNRAPGDLYKHLTSRLLPQD